MSKKDITVKKHFKLELPDPQHTIWADQALAPLEDWFPAATYVLDIKQHQQKPGKASLPMILLKKLAV